MAFHYFATAQDLVEIYADIEAQAPIRIVYEHDMPGLEKEYFLSLMEIPGVANDGTLTRCESFNQIPGAEIPQLPAEVSKKSMSFSLSNTRIASASSSGTFLSENSNTAMFNSCSGCPSYHQPQAYFTAFFL